MVDLVYILEYDIINIIIYKYYLYFLREILILKTNYQV